jgi:diguanylate cyclase (GGDEF)-like protein
VRHCPAHALRVVDDRIEIIQERCVQCGACVVECARFGYKVRSDLPRVKELLAGERQVVALLASEHIAAMYPLTTPELEQSLRDAGFIGVETTVLGEEMVAAAYEVVHEHGGAYPPRLRSTCPVAVEWVKRFHPEFVGALVNVVPPYIAQARLIRELYPEDVAVVYISPCWARKDEVYSADLLGDVDVAIGFDELRELLEGAETPPVAERTSRHVRAAKEISATDGFPRRTLRDSDLTDVDVRTVRGLDDIDNLLTAIKRGETAPAVVDMLACEGCIDGPCVNREISVFAKRNIDVAERQRQMPPAVDSRTFLAALPHVDLVRSFEPQPAISRQPSEEEIDAILAAGEFFARDETIDCGVCGYDTCVEHAAAIWLGNSTWEMCLPLERKRLMREHDRLSQASMTDELTGLLNRRALDRRLAEEIARADRYGTPLSLLVLDLDRFKQVNDRLGHSAGDAMLRAVGVLLRSEVRATDIAARYGGDEFALVLPEVNKTGAWAVAEKIRASFRTLSVDTGGGVRTSTSCSIGVATLGGDYTDMDSLFNAADSALYTAKEAGRDRVELAAG